jgi:hypothetical protein
MSPLSPRAEACEPGICTVIRLVPVPAQRGRGGATERGAEGRGQGQGTGDSANQSHHGGPNGIPNPDPAVGVERWVYGAGRPPGDGDPDFAGGARSL